MSRLRIKANHNCSFLKKNNLQQLQILKEIFTILKIKYWFLSFLYYYLSHENTDFDYFLWCPFLTWCSSWKLICLVMMRSQNCSAWGSKALYMIFMMQQASLKKKQRALFTIARTWKQPKCPSTDEWIKNMWHIYTVEYYSAIKRNEIELFVVRWMDLESDTEWSKSERENQIPYANTYIWNLKKTVFLKNLGAGQE